MVMETNEKIGVENVKESKNPPCCDARDFFFFLAVSNYKLPEKDFIYVWDLQNE